MVNIPICLVSYYQKLDFTPYWVCDGEFPESAEDYNEYICSGSEFSVDDDPGAIAIGKEAIMGREKVIANLTSAG